MEINDNDENRSNDEFDTAGVELVDQLSKIGDRIEAVFGFQAKAGQLSAIHQLVYNKGDLILIARTGFGKSVVFQAIPLLDSKNRACCLVIMPLSLLEDDQKTKLDNIKGARPFVLNGLNNSRVNREAIGRGEYTHVFVSPEIVLSSSFNNDTLNKQEFQRRLVLVAIDEIHIASEWGVFRKDYRKLHVLRTRVSREVPFLGMSATLESSILEEVKELAGFNRNVKIQRTPLNRPEIYIGIDSFKYPASSYKDLDFLLPHQATEPQDIPKTVVYMNEIRLIVEAIGCLRLWMSQRAYPPISQKWIQPIFSTMATCDKVRVSNAFSIPNQDCNDVRIIVATDSYGLGVDNPDIERVIQWNLPPSLPSLSQRMGRASRRGQVVATFLLLYPAWCIGPLTRNQSKSSSQPSRLQNTQNADSSEEASNDDEEIKHKKSGVTGPERRAKMARGLYLFLNSKTCQRQILLAFFDDTGCMNLDTNHSRCCAYCHPELLPERTVHGSRPQKQINKKNSHMQPLRLEKLLSWRESKVQQRLANSAFRINAEAVASDSVLNEIAKYGDVIKDEATLVEWGGAGAAFIPDSQEIISLMKGGDYSGFLKDDNEYYLTWFEQNTRAADRRKGLLSTPLSTLEERDKERKKWQANKGFRSPPKPKKRKKAGIDLLQYVLTQETSRRCADGQSEITLSLSQKSEGFSSQTAHSQQSMDSSFNGSSLILSQAESPVSSQELLPATTDVVRVQKRKRMPLVELEPNEKLSDPPRITKSGRQPKRTSRAIAALSFSR